MVATERALRERELNRAVLARQRLLERSGGSVPQVLERVAGLQAPADSGTRAGPCSTTCLEPRGPMLTPRQQCGSSRPGMPCCSSIAGGQESFLVDGCVAGAWKFEHGQVTIAPIDPLDASVRHDLDEEGQRLADLHR